MRDINKVDIFRYYCFWNDIEQYLIENIKNGDQKSFDNYLKYMKIIRNFKRGKTNNVFKIVQDFMKTADKTSVNKLSEIFYNNKLLPKNNKNAFVASSKIIWIFNNEQVIYDNNNKKKLQCNGHVITDYASYLNAWNFEYKKTSPSIKRIIQNLNLQRIDPIFNEEWFQKRIFDMYLWKVEQKII